MKYSYLILALFIVTGVNAQRDTPSSEEVALARKLANQFPDDDLVVLNKNIKVSFDLDDSDGLVEVEREESLIFMNITDRSEFLYQVGYDDQSEIKEIDVEDRRGRNVYKQFDDHAIKSESMFHTDYREKCAPFRFPVLGYQMKVDQEILVHDIKYFTTIYLSEAYPVINGKITIEVPDWLKIDFKDFNFSESKVNVERSKDGDETILTYTYEDMSGMADEPNTPGPSHLYPHLLVLPKSYTYRDVTYRIFQDTGDLYNWYAGLVNQVTSDNSEIKEKVVELTGKLESEKAKIEAIYYWVQDNIKYLAFLDGIAGFQPESPEKVFQKRYGDCKGMAILTKTMLELAGFDARLVWIGTDRKVYDYSTPSLAVDNHMITAVMMNGEPVFLDATEKFSDFGSFATRIQGKQALIENGQDYILSTVPKNQDAVNREFYQGDFKISGDNILGSMRRTFSGESRGMFQYNLSNLKTNDQSEGLGYFLAEGDKNTTISNVGEFDVFTRESELVLNYDVAYNHSVSNFGESYYINLDHIQYLKGMEIPEDRVQPVQLSFKKSEEKQISLDIENMEVESLPDPVQLNNELLRADLSFSQSEGKLIYSNIIKLKKRTIDPEEFELWNESVNRIKEFYEQQIVLEKQP